MLDERAEATRGAREETYEPPAIAGLGSMADLTGGTTTGDAGSPVDFDDN